MVDGIWSPVYGKASFLGSSILHFDLFLAAGFGVVWSATSLEPRDEGPHLATDIGGGVRFYPKEWLAFELGLMATLYPDQPILSVPGTVQSVFVANVGLSFFFPRASSTSTHDRAPSPNKRPRARRRRPRRGGAASRPRADAGGRVRGQDPARVRPAVPQGGPLRAHREREPVAERRVLLEVLRRPEARVPPQRGVVRLGPRRPRTTAATGSAVVCPKDTGCVDAGDAMLLQVPGKLRGSSAPRSPGRRCTAS